MKHTQLWQKEWLLLAYRAYLIIITPLNFLIFRLEIGYGRSVFLMSNPFILGILAGIVMVYALFNEWFNSFYVTTMGITYFFMLIGYYRMMIDNLIAYSFVIIILAVPIIGLLLLMYPNDPIRTQNLRSEFTNDHTRHNYLIIFTIAQTISLLVGVLTYKSAILIQGHPIIKQLLLYFSIPYLITTFLCVRKILYNPIQLQYFLVGNIFLTLIATIVTIYTPLIIVIYLNLMLFVLLDVNTDLFERHPVVNLLYPKFSEYEQHQ